jgi:hypothetical protein
MLYRKHQFFVVNLMGMMPYPYMTNPHMVNPYYLLSRLQPAIRHGLVEMSKTSPKHAMSQVVLITYLMGMGYDYRSARRIVESWEVDEKLLGEEYI